MELIPSLRLLAADALTVDFLQRPAYWAPRVTQVLNLSKRLPLIEHSCVLNCQYSVDDEGCIWYGGRYCYRKEDGHVTAYDLVTGDFTRKPGAMFDPYCNLYGIGLLHNRKITYFLPDMRRVLYCGDNHDFLAYGSNYQIGDLAGPYDLYKAGRCIGRWERDASYWYLGGTAWRVTETNGVATITNMESGVSFTRPGLVYPDQLLHSYAGRTLYGTRTGDLIDVPGDVLSADENMLVVRDSRGVYCTDGTDSRHWPGIVVLGRGDYPICITGDGYCVVIDTTACRARRIDLRDTKIEELNKTMIKTGNNTYTPTGWRRNTATNNISVNLFDFPMTLYERWCLAHLIKHKQFYWTREPSV